jgi:hypothetical protein
MSTALCVPGAVELILPLGAAQVGPSSLEHPALPSAARTPCLSTCSHAMLGTGTKDGKEGKRDRARRVLEKSLEKSLSLPSRGDRGLGSRTRSTDPLHPTSPFDTDAPGPGRPSGDARGLGFGGPAVTSHKSSNMFGRGLFRVSSIGNHNGGSGDGETAQGKRIGPSLFTFTPLKPSAPAIAVEDVKDTSSGSGFSQAGGHDGAFKATGEHLAKAVGERERTFYENAFKVGMWPIAFLPRYCGDMGDGRIGLENLVHGMENPCVLDFKLGTSSVEETEKSFAKKARMTALDVVTRTKAAGVRLEGMSMYRVLEQAKIKTSKSQSHAISASIGVSLVDVLTFFLTDESGVRTDVALRFQAHLEAILHYFVTRNIYRFKFIGSSILLVYDNDNRTPRMQWARALERLTPLGEDDLSGLTRRTKVDVRMIDFAHVQHNNPPDGGSASAASGRDDGYITGLNSILSALRTIRATRARPIFSLAAAASDAMIGASNAKISLLERHSSLPAGCDVVSPGDVSRGYPCEDEVDGALEADEVPDSFNFSSLVRQMQETSKSAGNSVEDDDGLDSVLMPAVDVPETCLI